MKPAYIRALLVSCSIISFTACTKEDLRLETHPGNLQGTWALSLYTKTKIGDWRENWVGYERFYELRKNGEGILHAKSRDPYGVIQPGLTQYRLKWFYKKADAELHIDNLQATELGEELLLYRIDRIEKDRILMKSTEMDPKLVETPLENIDSIRLVLRREQL